MNSPARLSRRAEFYEQLASCVEAGVTLVDALRIASKRTRPRAAGVDIAALLAALAQGRTFGEALGDAASDLPTFDRTLLSAGEASGRLDHTLRLLAEHYRDQAALLRTLIGGMAYPAFVALVAVLIFPISALTDLVKGGSLATFLLGKVMMVVPILAAVFALAWVMQGERNSGIRSMVERALGFIPGLGTARQNLALSRLASMLHALVSSGVLLIQAWEMAGDACGSPRYQRLIRSWRPRLDAGATPAELISDCGAFPELFTTLYCSGEMSGKLEGSLAQLQRHYHEEGSRSLKTFAAVLVMGVYLSVVVAVAWQIISFWVGYTQQFDNIFK